MKPWIRRLAMVLGILIPGLLMIFLQVDPLVLFTELGLIAVVILFASGSITPADLKRLRRGAGTQPAKEPEVAVKPKEAVPTPEKAGAKTSRFREISRAFGNVGVIAGERWKTWRAGKTRVEAIDRALDRTVPPPSARSSPASSPLPGQGAARAGPPVPGGDPFQDLLNANFEPVLLEEETDAGDAGMPAKSSAVPGKEFTIPVRKPEPEMAGKGAQVPVKNGELPVTDFTIPVIAPEPEMEMIPTLIPAGPRKETTIVKSPTVKVESVTAPTAKGTAAVFPAAPSRQSGVPAKGSPEIPVKGGETMTPVILSHPQAAGIPSGGKRDAPSRSTVTVTVTETTAKTGGPAATAARPAADPDILTFAPEAGGTMDDLLASLKEDETRVKRSDDSSLLRRLKGLHLPGKELEDDLSSLLKELE